MRVLLAVLAMLVLATPAFAQSTATPVLPGLLVSSPCNPGQTVCFAPYSNSNPLPMTCVSGCSGGGGGSTVATSAVLAPTVTPTISTSAYTAGYLFSLPMSFTVTNGGAIANAGVTLNTGTYTGGIDLLLFNAALTGSYTANTALALTQTDMGKFIGVLHLSDCRASATTGTVCQQLYQSQFYKLGGANTTIYGVPVIIAAGTFTNATDATFYLDQVQ